MRFLLLAALVLNGLLPLNVSASSGLQPLDDDAMAGVSGAGIAVAFDDFRFMMAPTSYFEQVGIAPADACAGSGGVASNIDCWRRGDLRWYGVNISGAEDLAGSGLGWTEATCNPGSATMGCPRGGVISNFAPFDNPYIMRSWSPEGMGFDGELINDDPNNPSKTIYEYLAPTSQPDYILSFWGEIEAGATRNPATQPLSEGLGSASAAGGGLLKSQTIIRGNAAGSIFRLFRFAETGLDPRYGDTFSILYHSRLQGDFRFSVAQQPGEVSDVIGQPVRFADQEGLHFRNVDAFLPLGQLYYQAFVLSAIGTTGNFSLSLTKIPDQSNVYQRFYGLNAGDTLGYETARLAVANWDSPCPVGDVACQNYRLTHGHVRYGDWYPGSTSGTRNTADSTEDGIFFRACADCDNFNAFARRPLVIDKRGETFSRQRTQTYNCATGNTGSCSVNVASGGPVFSASGGDLSRTFPTSSVNLGDARMEGLLINQLDIVSCQAGGGAC